jgi:hypothetical protein
MRATVAGDGLNWFVSAYAVVEASSTVPITIVDILIFFSPFFLLKRPLAGSGREVYQSV